MACLFGFTPERTEPQIKANSNFALTKTRNWLNNQVFKKVTEGIQELRRGFLGR